MSEDATAERADATWTTAERDAVLSVRKELISERGLKPHQCGEVELITITLNSKCRVQEAVDKFMTYHEQLLLEYGIEDVWADWTELDGQWHRLAACGLDEADRQVHFARKPTCAAPNRSRWLRHKWV